MKADIDTLMQKYNLDGLWVLGDLFNNAPMTYFTGIHHATFCNFIKVKNKPPVLFYQTMEREEAGKSGLPTRDSQDFPTSQYLEKTGGDRAAAYGLKLADMLRDSGIENGRVGVYGQVEASIFYAPLDALHQALPHLTLVGSLQGQEDPISMARMTKDQSEAEEIRRVGKLTTEVVAKTADFLASRQAKNGHLVFPDGEPIRVKDVKQRISFLLAEAGLDNPEGTIFSIGRDGAIPHSSGNPEDVLELGKPIVFDIFPRGAGGSYFYDMTRSWCLGYAPDEVAMLHQQVFEVHQAVIKALKPRALFSDSQKLTCKLFREMGHATIEDDLSIQSGYVHSVGHGVGLDIHEKPFSGMIATSTDTLEPGVVITVEPGLYYPERGMGMRIEDTLYLNSAGKFEILADFPYDLVIPIKEA